MKNMCVNFKKMLIFSGAILALTPSAYADSVSGFFLEPAITYEKGDSVGNYPSPLSDSSGEITGLGLGARFGFHLQEAFFLGLDLRYSMPQFKDSSVDYNAKAASTNWGPIVGMQMPIVGLRIWGAYVMGGELNPEADGGLDVKFQEAKGYRVGAGFRLTAFSVNLEYQDLKYDQAKLEKLGPFATNTTFKNVDFNTKTWLVSASFPMEL